MRQLESLQWHGYSILELHAGPGLDSKKVTELESKFVCGGRDNA